MIVDRFAAGIASGVRPLAMQHRTWRAKEVFSHTEMKVGDLCEGSALATQAKARWQLGVLRWQGVQLCAMSAACHCTRTQRARAAHDHARQQQCTWSCRRYGEHCRTRLRFSQAAVQVILNMPDHLTPEMFLCIGHAAPKKQQGMKSRKKTTWQDLTYWERFE